MSHTIKQVTKSKAKKEAIKRETIRIREEKEQAALIQWRSQFDLEDKDAQKLPLFFMDDEEDPRLPRFESVGIETKRTKLETVMFQ